MPERGKMKAPALTEAFKGGPPRFDLGVDVPRHAKVNLSRASRAMVKIT